MSCELPPDVNAQVRHWMETGLYASEADVLRDALSALKSRDEEVAAIQAGIDDMNAGRILPFDTVDSEIRERFGFSKKT